MEDLEKQIEEYALESSGLKEGFDRKEEEYYQREKVYVYDLVKTIIKSETAKAYHTKGMYSEEEVRAFLLDLKSDCINYHKAQIININTNEWFNKIKRNEKK